MYFNGHIVGQPSKRECRQNDRKCRKMSEKCPKIVRRAENTICRHFLDNFCLFGRCLCLVIKTESVSSTTPFLPGFSGICLCNANRFFELDQIQRRVCLCSWNSIAPTEMSMSSFWPPKNAPSQQQRGLCKGGDIAFYWGVFGASRYTSRDTARDWIANREIVGHYAWQCTD